MDLRVGQVLCDSGSAPAYAYFPTTAIVSLVCKTLDGASAEIAVVGRDGVVGLSLVMDGNAMTSEALVHSAGQAYRLRSLAVKSELARGGPVLGALLRYTLAVMAQVTFTAACNRHHSIEQQLCRRLLLALDRSPCDELVMTHRLMSTLLGVRRESVTAAARRLRQAGVIQCRRGHITVLDRHRLETRACECYLAARKESDRLSALASVATEERHSVTSCPHAGPAPH